MHHWATPPNIAKAESSARQKAVQGANDHGQQQLGNMGFKAMTGPREFTRAGTLHVVANLIVTNNQVS
jgi:hypothetical protein